MSKLVVGSFFVCSILMSVVAYGDATISAAEGVCTIDVPSGDVNISTLDLTKLTGNDLEKTGAAVSSFARWSATSSTS